MRRFDWSHADPAPKVRHLDLPEVVYVISDLHLGDGSHSDTFLAKDRLLLAFLEKVREEGATLIVAGDVIDFAQTRDFAKVLTVHGAIFRAFADLVALDRFYYVYGNHDHDMRLYRDILRFPVVASVEIGKEMRIIHGYQFDPLISGDLPASDRRTRRHHVAEHWLRSWIRVPLGHFYTRLNRLVFWFSYQIYCLMGLFNRLVARMDKGPFFTRRIFFADYWIRGDKGNPSGMWKGLVRAIEEGEHRILVCGHSHMPGVVDVGGGRLYANTGSWTFNSTNYLRWEPGESPVVGDWLSGRTYGDQLYDRVRSGELDHYTFHDWWAEEYQGFLRYRCGEDRRGKLPAWTVPPALPDQESS